MTRPHKRCSKCGGEWSGAKALKENFYVSRRTRDGFMGQCKACVRAKRNKTAGHFRRPAIDVPEHVCKEYKFVLDEETGLYLCPVCGLPYSSDIGHIQDRQEVPAQTVPEVETWMPWKNLDWT